MTEKNRRWNLHVQPHYPLIQITEDLWQVTGSFARGHLPRNMVIHRMDGGDLWLHSVIALHDESMRQLEALGVPEFLVVPNRRHCMDAAVYKERYPKVKVLCPEAAFQQVRKILPVHGLAEEVLPMLGVGCHQPAGIRPYELCYEVGTESSKVLVFTDLLFNLGTLSGFDGWLMKMTGFTGFFGLTTFGRFAYLKKREAFAEWLRKMASIDGLKAICVAHGDAITQDPSERLEDLADQIFKIEKF